MTGDPEMQRLEYECAIESKRLELATLRLQRLEAEHKAVALGAPAFGAPASTMTGQSPPVAVLTQRVRPPPVPPPAPPSALAQPPSSVFLAPLDYAAAAVTATAADPVSTALMSSSPSSAHRSVRHRPWESTAPPVPGHSKSGDYKARLLAEHVRILRQAAAAGTAAAVAASAAADDDSASTTATKSSPASSKSTPASSNPEAAKAARLLQHLLEEPTAIQCPLARIFVLQIAGAHRRLLHAPNKNNHPDRADDYADLNAVALDAVLAHTHKWRNHSSFYSQLDAVLGRRRPDARSGVTIAPVPATRQSSARKRRRPAPEGTDATVAGGRSLAPQLPSSSCSCSSSSAAAVLRADADADTNSHTHVDDYVRVKDDGNVTRDAEDIVELPAKAGSQAARVVAAAQVPAVNKMKKKRRIGRPGAISSFARFDRPRPKDREEQDRLREWLDKNDWTMEQVYESVRDSWSGLSLASLRIWLNGDTRQTVHMVRYVNDAVCHFRRCNRSSPPPGDGDGVEGGSPLDGQQEQMGDETMRDAGAADAITEAHAVLDMAKEIPTGTMSALLAAVESDGASSSFISS